MLPWQPAKGKKCDTKIVTIAFEAAIERALHLRLTGKTERVYTGHYYMLTWIEIKHECPFAFNFPLTSELYYVELEVVDILLTGECQSDEDNLYRPTDPYLLLLLPIDACIIVAKKATTLLGIPRGIPIAVGLSDQSGQQCNSPTIIIISPFISGVWCKNNASF